MKILHVVNSCDPATGGPAAGVLRLAAAQAGLRHDVHLLTYRTPASESSIKTEIARVPGLELVRRHHLPSPTRWERWAASAAYRKLQSHIIGANFVHLHGVWDPILRAAAKRAAAAKVHYAVAPHGMLDPWSLQQKAIKKQIALFLGYRKMLDRAAFIQVLNVDEQRLLLPLGLTTRVEVIPNGVFLEEFNHPPATQDFRSKHPRLGEASYVLFLSRLHYKKGLDYLAEAFAVLSRAAPGVHLVVAGPDAGEQTAFEQRVRAAGLAEMVHLVGPLYGEEKLAALAGASCFCLPSRQEGFSVAVLEALACRVPVLISEACHFPEVAAVGAGEVFPLQSDAIAAALLRVVADPAARERMGHVGRTLIASRYTWPAVAEVTLRAYDAACASGFGSAGVPTVS